LAFCTTITNTGDWFDGISTKTIVQSGRVPGWNVTGCDAARWVSSRKKAAFDPFDDLTQCFPAEMKLCTATGLGAAVRGAVAVLALGAIAALVLVLALALDPAAVLELPEEQADRVAAASNASPTIARRRPVLRFPMCPPCRRRRGRATAVLDSVCAPCSRTA
jgi:hypothetical protein